MATKPTITRCPELDRDRLGSVLPDVSNAYMVEGIGVFYTRTTPMAEFVMLPENFGGLLRQYRMEWNEAPEEAIARVIREVQEEAS